MNPKHPVEDLSDLAENLSLDLSGTTAKAPLLPLRQCSFSGN